MKNYKLQNGCYNCQYVFCRHDRDDDDQFFCNIKKKRPPKCDRTKLQEEWCGGSLVLSWNRTASSERKWNKWAKGKDVAIFGTCDNWIDKGKEDEK